LRVTSGQRKVDVLHSYPSLAQARSSSTYELYVHDGRYSVPTLKLMNTDSEDEALRMAKASLSESEHHLRVELWLGAQRVAAWTRDGAALA